MIYRFPTRYLYQEHSFNNPLHISKFAIRYWRAKPYIQNFEAFVNQSPILVSLFNNRQELSYTLLKNFADKTLPNKQKHQLLIDDWQRNLQILQTIDPNNTLLRQQKYVLADILDDYTASLEFNTICCEEGFWCISLRKKSNDELIYQCTFVLLADKQMLITSMQGPKMDAGICMSALTKVFFGMRPHFLLIQIVREFAKQIGITSLLGIPFQNQIKTRRYNNKVKFDYNSFWSECQGKTNAALGYYQIPLEACRKDLSEIASKKRSMYRKRYALLDALQDSIHSNIPK